MFFNSYEFIFLFLPLTLLGFYKLGDLGNKRLQFIWLIIASLIFYGRWNPAYVLLLLTSVGVNYTVGLALTQAHLTTNEKLGKLWLIAGIIFNVGLLGYYKYSNFFIDTANSAFGTSLFISSIVLPLGISFYTFQQIAYLFDTREGETKDYSFLEYCLFVCFFPYISAGPIVNHKEMMPQYSKQSTFKLDQGDLIVGFTIFSMGLFKKVIFADQIALYANPIFSAAAQGIPLTVSEAWMGALAYTLQMYFDFSGYSDMAVGVGRMFGFRLPLNFNSPYKAVNVIDYWGGWHMTLTRFLTRYLYNPIALSMSRRRVKQGKSLIKRGVGSLGAFANLVAIPMIITMFIAGFWHGAGWQYIVFGVLHGVYLSINHGWHMIRKRLGHDLKQSHWWAQRLGQLITFIGVVIALVFFRAPNVSTANALLASMVGGHGLSLAKSAWFVNDVIDNPSAGIEFIALLLLIVFWLPNTHWWMAKYEPALGYNPSQNLKHQPQWLVKFWQNLEWRPTRTWAVISAAITVTAFLGLSRVNQFIYFQF